MAWNDDLLHGSPAYNLASTDARVIRAVAGPGSGKSYAIKRRIARLLEDGVAPENILAITFTRTAANDLKREISSLGIPGADEVHSRTLHSHALKILMQANVLAATGRTPRMVLEHEIAPALRDLDDAFGGVTEKKKLFDSYLAAWARLQSDTPGFVKDEVQGRFEQGLISWLSNHKGILVGEVVPVAIDFLRNNPAFPEIGKYSVILVDEYQDLNRSEQEFIRLIKGEAAIVIVGDDDQSIYGFKFAHPQGIREIDRLYGAFEDIPFNECRRCPTQVTTMASQLISNNPNRTLGALVPHAANNVGNVQIVQWKTYGDEIEGLSNIIVDELAKGVLSPQDILVLAPRRKIGYRLRDLLLITGIPVKSYFRESAISKDTVKRAYSLLNYLANPGDMISLRFLLGFDSADFRRAQYSRLTSIAAEKGLTIPETLTHILQGKIEQKGLITIVAEYRKIVSDVAQLKKAVLEDPEKAIQNFFIKNEDDETEFYEINQLYQKSVADVGADNFADPEQFDALFKSVFDSLQVNIALPEPPDDIDHIRIMSLHASKGLSAKFVVLCSMIDDLMPFIPPGLSPEETTATIEEQRRLFYVAITRCKASDAYPGRLIISSFLLIAGIDALRMGIPANPKAALNVASTRFLREFRETSPAPVKGETLVVEIKD